MTALAASLLLLALGADPAPRAEHAARIEERAVSLGLSAESRSELTAAVRRADAAGVPWQIVEAKILEGLAKRIDPARVVSVADDLSRRLSIVDLSPGGHQPMCDPLTGNWVVYNGEIYNHVELRRELEGRGCALRTGSDTEVLLAAYREWGRDCLARLNGMWGFALWDARLSELFCARDRLGVKPFYYQWDGDLFAFASEPKALVLTQARPVRADEVLIHALLALDRVDFSPRTFFAETTQLMPGHWLVVAPGRFQRLPQARDLQGNPARIHRLALGPRTADLDDQRLPDGDPRRHADASEDAWAHR